MLINCISQQGLIITFTPASVNMSASMACLLNRLLSQIVEVDNVV